MKWIHNLSMECYQLTYFFISMYLFGSARSFDFNFCFAKIFAQDDNYEIYLLQYSDYVPWVSFWSRRILDLTEDEVFVVGQMSISFHFSKKSVRRRPQKSNAFLLPLVQLLISHFLLLTPHFYSSIFNKPFPL